MSDPLADMDGWELIVALRGGVPDKCDFCGKVTEPRNMNPEEGGLWACIECLDRWDEEDRAIMGGEGEV